MACFSRILAPVEISLRCKSAARYADILACRFRAEVILLHVCTPRVADYSSIHTVTGLSAQDLAADVAAERLAELDGFPCGVPVRRMVRDGGEPAGVILDVAASEKCDLIMMPCHGHGTLRRFVHGSVTARVIHDAPCAVWTGCHIDEAGGKEPLEFHRVLCAVDLGPHTSRVMQWAAEFASEAGCELAIVDAVRPGALYFDSARERIGQFLRDPGFAGMVAVESGEVAEAVNRVAERARADLLVIGHGSNSPAHPHLPNHAYAIVRETACPVVAV
jgi:nucleotide-binding universal stress UspA family protein